MNASTISLLEEHSFPIFPIKAIKFILTTPESHCKVKKDLIVKYSKKKYSSEKSFSFSPYRNDMMVRIPFECI